MEWIETQYTWCNCSKDSLTKFIYIKELLLRYSYCFKILFKIIRLILWKHGSWLILYSFGITCNIYTISRCTKNWNFLLRISSVNVTKSAVSWVISKPPLTTYFPSGSLQRVWKLIGHDYDENMLEVYSG